MSNAELELIDALRRAGAKFQALAEQLEIYESGRMADPEKRLELATMMTHLADEIEPLLDACKDSDVPIGAHILTAVPILRSDAAVLRSRIHAVSGRRSRP